MADRIQKIIDETVFTMEAEGFILTSGEKDTLRKVLNGEISFEDQLKIYIDNARCAGRPSSISNR